MRISSSPNVPGIFKAKSLYQWRPAVTCSKFFFMQARSQKSAMGGRGGVARVWGQIPQPPEAIGVWGQGPQPLEAWGVGADPSALKIFLFFLARILILGLF